MEGLRHGRGHIWYNKTLIWIARRKYWSRGEALDQYSPLDKINLILDAPLSNKCVLLSTLGCSVSEIK